MAGVESRWRPRRPSGTGDASTTVQSKRTFTTNDGSHARPLVALAMVLVLALGVLAGGGGLVGSAAAANTIGSCTTISSSGSYVLSGDLAGTAGGDGTCIDIDADDVHLDGDGHTLDGSSAGGDPTAIEVSGAGFDNVTITDLTVDHYHNGTTFDGVDDGTLSNVVLDTTAYAVRLDDSTVTGTDVTIESGPTIDVDATDVILYQPEPTPPPSGQQVAGQDQFSQVSFERTSVGGSVDATIDYDESGIDESTVGLYEWTAGGGWGHVSLATVDTGANTVQHSLLAEGAKYAVLAEPASTPTPTPTPTATPTPEPSTPVDTGPTAVITDGHRVVSIGEQVTFDGSDSEGEGDLSYDWEVGGQDAGSGSTIEVTFDSANQYLVELTVEDADGGLDRSRVLVEVAEPTATPTPTPTPVDTDPTAVITGGDRTVPPGEQVILDGSNSEGEGDLSYYWYQDGHFVGRGSTFEVTFESAFETRFELVVEDSDGDADESAVDVDVEEPTPTQTATETSDTQTEVQTTPAEGPGFTALVALLTLVGGCWFLGRRR